MESLQKEVELLRLALNTTVEELRITKEELKNVKVENERLRQIIDELKHKKTSTNSSIAPSTDINKQTRSLRQKSGKKPGGQKGHQGTTLEFVSNPDEIEDQIPAFCRNCGLLLESTPELLESRQVKDVPIIKPVTTEYRKYSRICSCGHCNVGDFPVHAKARVNYGPNVEALCSYFSVRQYISYSRIQEMFADVFQLPISQGTIVNKIKSFSKSCVPLYETIKERVSNSKCVGIDETGARVATKLHWIWAWQTNLLTFLVVSTNRGIQTINDNFANSFINAILVHDCWRAHFNTLAKSHQICIAHLLRELQYFIELKNEWAYNFGQLLLKALDINKQRIANPSMDFSKQIKDLEDQKKILLSQSLEPKYKKLISLQNRLIKRNNYIFTFLYHTEVPPDNNGTERAIRNVKVKLKVSGQFRTYNGAKDYTIIRSVIDTTIKNGKNVFNALSLVPNFN